MQKTESVTEEKRTEEIDNKNADVITALMSKYIATKQKAFLRNAEKSISKINAEFSGLMTLRINKRDDAGEIVNTTEKTLSQKEQECFNLLGNKNKVLSLFSDADKTFIKGRINNSIKRTAAAFYRND